ncbi:MAG: hypothetical protein LT102_04175 [Burkholderiaceae bacterium]|nr:hypothetical protein [Burkholderiaceae bacterium]
MNDRTDPILPSRPDAPGQTLDLRARQWLDSLPVDQRLPVLRRHYPHVVNRLAADWHRPRHMIGVFDELLMDTRGTRNGFPFEAALELMQLREHYVSVLHPELHPEPTARDPEVWRGIWR